MGTLEREHGESLSVFRNAGRRSAVSAAQDDLTVVGTPRGGTIGYGTVIGGGTVLGGAVGSQQIWDEVSHIPEHEGASQSVAPRATVPRATPRPAPAPAPSRRSTNVMNWNGDPALGKLWQELKTQCGTVKQAAKRGEHGVTPLPSWGMSVR